MTIGSLVLLSAIYGVITDRIEIFQVILLKFLWIAV